ncbi:MAG: hypothetical protein ACXAD7_10350 [Candidatus Kariarchaeaceae archaeon]|jgi:hypothetical protein
MAAVIRGKGTFRGEITQIRVNQTQYYSRQWGIESRSRIYIISETINKFRKHDWLCSCPDWINHRQKYPEPHDRCKHIDAVVLRYSSRSVVSTRAVTAPVEIEEGLVSRIRNVQLIQHSDFENYQPFITLSCNWSGRDLHFNHILTMPSGSIPITIDAGQSSFPIGYIERDTAFIALNSHRFAEFDHKRFLLTYQQRQFSPEESERLLRMEAQRDRLEKNFGEAVTNEFEIFDGKFTGEDRSKLDALVRSTTIDDYEIIDSSIVLRFNQREIKMNNRSVWKGDYMILCGKFPKFYVMGKNINSRKYNGTSPHPHVNSGGHPCLNTYNEMIVRALNAREWQQFAVIVSDFLCQYNPSSPIVRL